MKRNSGFTLVEILVAVAVLTVGILGVLALFPIAMTAGKNAIETTNSVILAKSVAQAIREGITHRKGNSRDGRWTYFIFEHPGVKDPIPRRVQDARPDEDYYILLPDDDLNAPGRLTRVVERSLAYETSRVFVYPESDGKRWIDPLTGQEIEGDQEVIPNGGGDVLQADDDGDDNEDTFIDENGEQQSVRGVLVEKTYPIDEDFFTRYEDENDDFINPDGSDPIKNYSYAFTIRRAFNDASLARNRPRADRFVPANELYEVEIRIYKSFVNDSPIFTQTILVHK